MSLIVTIKELGRKLIDKATFFIRFRDLMYLKKKFYPDTSLLSMNCFAGHIYQDLSWKYNSPTAGLFFYADDFCSLLEDINVLKRPVLFREKSKWNSANEKMPFREHWYPIGYFEGTDIEIHFLHYHTEAEALDKWNRRMERFNFQDFYAIGFQQNECTMETIKKFSELKISNKAFFTNIDCGNLDGIIYIDKFKDKPNSPDPYKYVNTYYKYLVAYLKTKGV